MPKKDILLSRRQFNEIETKIQIRDTMVKKVVWHSINAAIKPEPLKYYLVFIVSESGDTWSEILAFNEDQSLISDNRNIKPLFYCEVPNPMPTI